MLFEFEPESSVLVGGENCLVLPAEYLTNSSPEHRSAAVRHRACWYHLQSVEAHPAVAAIPYSDLSSPQVAGGFLLLAGRFVLREIVSGALKEAGKGCGHG